MVLGWIILYGSNIVYGKLKKLLLWPSYDSNFY